MTFESSVQSQSVTSHDSSSDQQETSRRQFLERLSLGAGLGAGLAMTGCQSKPEASGEGSQKPLRAAFTNAALKNSWCAQGKTTAELWGKLLNVEIEWFDGESDPEKQRNKIDSITNKDWDFCCFQAVQTDCLREPVKKLKEREIPVISMDTLLVPMDEMREVGVWTEVMPDHVSMAKQSTEYLMKKIGGKGLVIHIGGLSSHSGAQGRKEGFDQVISRYSDVEIAGGEIRWCDWDKEKARNTFEAIINRTKEPIAGAFFHNDDMALACVPALKGTIHEKMVLAGVDGQREGLTGVKNGELAATTVNPTCRIHRTALTIGQFIARNQEKIDDVPLEIITPGPLVTLEDENVLNAMVYMADPAHCLI